MQTELLWRMWGFIVVIWCWGLLCNFWSVFSRKVNYKQSAWRLERKYSYQSTEELKSVWMTRCSTVGFLTNCSEIGFLFCHPWLIFCFSYSNIQDYFLFRDGDILGKYVEWVFIFSCCRTCWVPVIHGEKNLSRLFHVCFSFFFLCYYNCK